MSCTAGHNMDTKHTPTTSCLEFKQPCQARRGAPFPTTPSHHGHKQLSRDPPGPSPAAPGSPVDPACQDAPPASQAGPHPGKSGRPTAAAPGTLSWKRPQCCTPSFFFLFSAPRVHSGHPSPPAPSAARSRGREGPARGLLAGSPASARPPAARRPAPGPGQPCLPLPLPGGPARHGQSPPLYLEAAGGGST